MMRKLESQNLTVSYVGPCNTGFLESHIDVALCGAMCMHYTIENCKVCWEWTKFMSVRPNSSRNSIPCLIFPHDWTFAVIGLNYHKNRVEFFLRKSHANHHANDLTSQWSVSILCMIAKFNCTMAFYFYYLQSIELFPTCKLFFASQLVSAF